MIIFGLHRTNCRRTKSLNGRGSRGTGLDARHLPFNLSQLVMSNELNALASCFLQSSLAHQIELERPPGAHFLGGIQRGHFGSASRRVKNARLSVWSTYQMTWVLTAF